MCMLVWLGEKEKGQDFEALFCLNFIWHYLIEILFSWAFHIKSFLFVVPNRNKQTNKKLSDSFLPFPATLNILFSFGCSSLLGVPQWAKLHIRLSSYLTLHAIHEAIWAQTCILRIRRPQRCPSPAVFSAILFIQHWLNCCSFQVKGIQWKKERCA